MPDRFRITLGQLNPTAGDLSANAAQARAAWQAGRAAKAQMVALPEMFLTGAAGDLLRKPAFSREVKAHLEALATDCSDGPALGIGAPWQEAEQLFNAYLILENGKITQRILKHRLRRDEFALFNAGPISGPYAVAGLRIGSPIGTDATEPDVAETLEETGAEILLIPNAAPYRRGVMDLRFNHMVARVIETELSLIYLNQTGGWEDNIFDGASFALNRGGKLVRQLPSFTDALTHIDLERGPEGWQVVPGEIAPQPSDQEKDYRALVVGVGDHLHKNGCTKAVLAMTRNVKSALVATIAADALGPENLICVHLPGEDTVGADQERSKELAEKLGCVFKVAPISPLPERVLETLAPLGDDALSSQQKKDLHTRMRGLLLQTIADAQEALPLSIDSKSDRALGRSVAGDMVNNYAALGDLYDTEVFDLCHWRDSHHRPWMLGRAGSELPLSDFAASPDTQSRDDILRILLDKDGTAADCETAGHDYAVIAQIAERIGGSATKRGRATLGLRLKRD